MRVVLDRLAGGHLSSDVVQFLHPHELLHVTICFLLAIVQVVVVLEPVVVKLMSELLDCVAVSLHLDDMLLHKFLDRLDLNVLLHLNWSKQLPQHVCDHPSRDLVELLLKVGALELLEALVHLKPLVVEVFEDKVLALLHLANCFHLFIHNRKQRLCVVLFEVVETLFEFFVG